MRKIILLIAISILVINCSKEEEKVRTYNATVLHKGLDCGETFLIQFDSNTDISTSNNLDNIFYAINLRDEYKIENLEINVTFREPSIEETLTCTNQGPDYPQIFIIKSEL